MSTPRAHAVTGAFGYSGRYIARRLLAKGHRVVTLTNSPHRQHDLAQPVEARPLCFNQPHQLEEHLKDVDVLYNTYWVRFNHRNFSYQEAVRNTINLINAARGAGVQRIVHVSITNADEASSLDYFRGKGRLERAIRESGLSYAILRPAVLFGQQDILINNIAWALRRLPFFGVFGGGDYRLQPIYVDDLAALAVEQGASRDNRVINAIGPETFTYQGLVEAVAEAIGRRTRILRVSPGVGYAVGRVLGLFVGDTLITRDEIKGLMGDLLYTDAEPTGTTVLTEWARQNADLLGRSYTSELARRKNRELGYDKV